MPDAQHHEPVAQAQPLWFGESESQLFGWLHSPLYQARGAVVLCPPIGYDLWVSYQSLRCLAQRLAAQGFYALRFDYAATGDSAGSASDAELVTRWQDSISQAVTTIRAAAPGLAVSLVGLRMGATLALQRAAALGIDTVVMWDPVISGRRYARELKVLANPEMSDDGVLEVAGCVYSAETLAAISQIDLARIHPEQIKQVLLLDRDDRPGNAALREQLSAVAQVDHMAISGMQAMLDVSTEDAQVPEAAIAAITQWLQQKFPVNPPKTDRTELKSFSSSAVLSIDDTRITEELVHIGDLPLFGILGAPFSAQAGHLVIFLSSGIEHRIGPGRTWVEFSRAMNVAGIATLRIDFDGVGDSPVRGTPRGVRPYDPQFLEDVQDFIRFGRMRGYSRVSVLGLCSGAWMALQAGLTLGADSVIAINPQLYWKMGDPVESLLQDTRARRASECRRELLGQRWGLWTLQDMLGFRSTSGRCLDALMAKGVPTLLVFAQNDDGIQHLRIRCQRRLKKVLSSGCVSIKEIEGIDHPMHRHRHRPAVYEAIVDFLTGL